MKAQIVGFAVALATAAVAAGGAARANDSTAGLAAGGLVLTKSADIEMRSEDLYISEKLVRVRYSFVNDAPNDVTVTVAFPLPDIDINGYDDTVDIPVDNATNFLGFTTLVNGTPVKMQVEQKALVDGKDFTAVLEKYHVPLAAQLQSTSDFVAKLPRAAQDELVKDGLASADEFDNHDGKGMQRQVVAHWTVRTTFYWTQTFPAGRPLAVEHRYTPSVGGFVSTDLIDPSNGSDADEVNLAKAERKDYCVDDNIVATVSAAFKAHPNTLPWHDEYIAYVLTTGANWKLPIGDFRMTIDKGKAANLVSFCGTGVVKTGPTTFQVHYTHFTPTADVKVLVLLPQDAN
ncbi:MAG TPA: DUF4424 domain-containing protein [Caulobacteraceae bacterium]|nr:DUF4424 domain-containing protein [Caulobacteraceae bacterium]